jgi:hypothetical protein
MGGDFGFWDLRYSVRARRVDIPASVPLQDLGFGRPAALLAVQRLRKELDSARKI